MAKSKKGLIYLLHLSRPLEHARHYLGFAESDVKARLERHRSGRGAKMLAAATQNGISYRVARIWRGVTRDQERALKVSVGGMKHLLCPVCSGPHAHTRKKFL